MAADLFCGLGGWTEGLLAEGWRVRGYDIEEHVYGDERYPGELVIRDVLTLHGSELADADLIVASPPCQEFSYMAMPWSRAKQIARALRGEGDFPEGYTGSRTIAELRRLFDACFRIQREASEAAGRYIPMVVENVRGAQPWLGPSAWAFGSYYLWGDVPALMPTPIRATKVPGFRFDGSGGSFQTASVKGVKNRDADGYEHTHPNAVGWKAPRTSSGSPGRKAGARRDAAAVDENYAPGEGIKGAGYCWFKAGTGAWANDPISRAGSAKSTARKAASAKIAKIPLALSSHIARVYLPTRAEAA